MEGTLFWIDDAVIPTEVSHLMLGNNFPNTVSFTCRGVATPVTEGGAAFGETLVEKACEAVVNLRFRCHRQRKKMHVLQESHEGLEITVMCRRCHSLSI